MDLHLPAFAWAAATLAVAYGTGRRIADLLAPGWASEGERAVYAMGLGLALLSLLVLGVAAAGALAPAGLWSLWLLLATVSVAPVVDGLGAAARRVFPGRRPDKGGPPRPRDPLAAGLAAAAVLLAIVTLPRPLSPPTHSDSLAYHLAVPRLYAERGGLFFYPHLVHSNWQFLVQMLNLWGLVLDGDRLVQLLNHALWCLTGAAAAAVAGRQAGSRAGAIAALLVMGLRAARDLVGSATDMFGLTFYALLLLGAALAWWEAPGDRRKAALVGLCAGCCAATKILGLPIVALVLAACAVRAFRALPGPVRRRALAPVLPGALAALVAAPFYLKNWALAGNPVYPFAHGLFGGNAWNDRAAAELWALLDHFGDPVRGPAGWLVMPVHAVFHRSVLGLWLAPLALALVRPRDHRLWLPLGLFGALAALWWTGSQQSRFLLPARALLAAPVAVGLAAGLDRLRGARARGAASVALAAIVIGDACSQNVLPAFRRLRAAFVPAAAAEHVRREVEIQPAVEFVNANLPRPARVLFFNDARTYHMERAAFTAIPAYQAVFQWGPSDAPETVAALLRGHGVTHVLVNAQDGERWDGGALDRLLDRRGDLLFHRAGLAVYRLADADLPRRGRNVFREPAAARVEVSSAAPGTDPATLVDGDRYPRSAGPDRWASAAAPGGGDGEWAAARLPAPAAVSEFRVYAVPKRAPLPAAFVVEAFRDGRWAEIPETRVAGRAEEGEWFLPLREPVRSDAFRVRVTATTGGAVMLREIEAWGE